MAAINAASVVARIDAQGGFLGKDAIDRQAEQLAPQPDVKAWKLV